MSSYRFLLRHDITMLTIPATPIPTDTTNKAAITALNLRLDPALAWAVGFSGDTWIFHFPKAPSISSALLSRRLKLEQNKLIGNKIIDKGLRLSLFYISPSSPYEKLSTRRWGGREYNGLGGSCRIGHFRIGHFRVPFSLSFKASLSAKFLLW